MLKTAMRQFQAITNTLLVIGCLLVMPYLTVGANTSAKNEFESKMELPDAEPDDPTGSITPSGPTCGTKTLTRTDNPPPGIVWYWQTSASGTSLTDFGTTFTASESGIYYIRAYRPSSQEWSYGNINIAITVTPSAPTVLEETTNTSSSFVAKWSAVTNADDYRLDVSTNSSFTNILASYDDLTVTGTSKAVTGLDGGDYYYYRVRANDNGCVSGNSGTTTAHTILDTPVATSGDISNQTNTSFEAGWSSVQGTNSYRLDVSTNTGFTTYVSGYQDRAVVGTSEVVSGLNAASTYYYRVRAYSTPYTSGNSATVTATTILEIPTANEETNRTSDGFTVSWSAVSGAAAYRLDISTDVNFNNLVSGYNNKVVSQAYDDVTGLAPGTEYYYRVRAYSSVYTSGNSATITANTILDTPIAQSPACATTTSFTAEWSTVNGVDEYLLYVSTASNFSSHVSGYNGLSVSAGTTTKLVDGLTGGTYYYRLKSKNSVYTSGYSNTKTVNVPNMFNVTGGTICSDSGGLTIGLDGSQSGVEYHLYHNYVPVLVEGTSTIVKVFGTGSAVDFTDVSYDVGTYEVYAVEGGCTTKMSGEAKIVTKPTLVTVSGGGDFCSGTSGVPINLSSAEAGVTYELFRNGISTGHTTTTTSFPNQALTGDYTVKATRDGCTVTLAETVTATMIAPPAIPTDSVSTNACGDKTIFAINPPHASTNVFWKWQGTNSDGYSEDAFTSAGRVVDSTAIYYVRAKSDDTGCWSTSKAISVTVIPYPIKFMLSGGGDYCSGESSPAINTNGSESDVLYKLYKDDVYQSTEDKNGDVLGAALSWTGLVGGDYDVKGDRSGCETTLFTTTTITEHIVPTVDAGSDISVFNSDIFMLPNGDDGSSEWTSSTATIADNMYNARLDGPGSYTMTYTYTNEGGCSDSDTMVMTVLNDPDPIEVTSGSRFINSDPTASITPPTLTAPTGFTYQWYKDGVVMANETGNTLSPDEVGVYDVEIMATPGYGLRSNAIAVVPLRATDNVNHIITRQLRTAWTDENNLPTTDSQITNKYDFMDDLGRPVQTVIDNQSVSGKDLVQPMAYDEFGRSPKAYLPYTNAYGVVFKNDAVAEQANFYATTSNIDQDDYPYSENTFENSPLNRVLKTNAPGEVWAKNGLTVDGKPVTFGFSANVTGEVPRWKISSGNVVQDGNYAAKKLNKAVTTDENGNQVQEYTNLQGQVILKKVQISASAPSSDSDWYQTFYVYDKFNNLRYVLPPMAVQRYEEEGQATDSGDQLITQTSNYEDITTSSTAKVAFLPPAIIYVNEGTVLEEGAEIYDVDAANSTITLNTDFLAKWAFQYQYDDRQRMIVKQVPGADPVHMVYDQRDRLVMTQDGNQRADNKWSFTKYDELNRPVMTGIINESRTRSVLQIELDNWTNFVESYTGTGSLKGYDGAGYPANATAADLLTVTYYDDFGFTGDSHWTLGDFTNQPEARTLVTGSLVNVPNQGWNQMVTLYDEYFRVEKTVSLDYQTNRDSLINEYYSDVLPLVTQTTHIHMSALTNDTTTIVKDFTYDHADRLLSVSHKINYETAVVILENEYNELGELITKKLHKEAANQYTQEVDYQYNIRGWLTKINDPSAPTADDFFNMQLKYDEAGQYNGNIGEIDWKNPFETPVNTYEYTYDPVNRLKSAEYNHALTAGYSVSNIDYDANGNILALARYGDHDDQADQLFDDLDYDYVGNQLTKVTDASGFDTGFKDGVNVTTEYVYDANGNMIEDKNKGIESITYNHLNLPIRVEMNADGSNRIEYIYDAAGIKLAQLVYGADTLTKRTDYQGAFIYEATGSEASTLQFIQHEEGRVIPTQEGSEYQYHLKDHLGNVRATFKTTDDIEASLATFESAAQATEMQYFTGYDSMTVITATLFNHTSGGNTAIRLDGSTNEQEGLGKSLKVKPGDVIDMEVYAKYYDESESGSWVGTLGTIAGQIASGDPTVIGEGGGMGAFTFPFLALMNTGGDVSDGPDAYMNYMVFDQNYQLLSQGYEPVSSAAKEDGSDVSHEYLSASITIDQPGYVYVYLSNENSTPIDVFFDDFKVTQNHTKIVSKDDYYPFGLTFNNYSRPASIGQSFKYNEKELQDELGFNMIDFGARMHDPALARWFNIDPLAQNYRRFSPYNYTLNNPIVFIDPDGKRVSLFQESMQRNGGKAQSQEGEQKKEEEEEEQKKKNKNQKSGAPVMPPPSVAPGVGTFLLVAFWGEVNDAYMIKTAPKFEIKPYGAPRNETTKPEGWDGMSLDEKIEWLSSLEDPDLDDLDELDNLNYLKELGEKANSENGDEIDDASDHLRGGSQKDRDRYIMKFSTQFRRYYHREIKPKLGRDATNEELDEFEEDWYNNVWKK